MKEDRFNLIDEPWIPVIGVGRVSLKEIFSNENLQALGGNPIQKIALTKLLLAIAQSACTPQNDYAWRELCAHGLAEACRRYLEKWHDRFYLYGERPFLQMKAIEKADIQPFGALLPEIATGNTTVHTEIQQVKPLDDAEKALLVTQLMGFGLGGKKTDNTLVLSSGYGGKTKDNGKATTGKSGTSLGYMGFLHNFIQGSSLLETLWLNLMTQESLNECRYFSMGLGVAPWEQMPLGEDDDLARQLRSSLMGRLVPMNRFVLLAEEGIHYSEGIAHPSYPDGVVDPSVSVNFSSTKPKVLWVDAEKRPWRLLTALLSYISATSTDKFHCLQLENGLSRAAGQTEKIALWSGGLRVSSNAGEQYVSGSDDFVESLIALPVEELGESWFAHLSSELKELEDCSNKLYGCVRGYYKALTSDGSKQAGQATRLFWQLCEDPFRKLIPCVEDGDKRYQFRIKIGGILRRVYAESCPMETARQIDAWARGAPNLGKYLIKNNNS